MNLADWVIDYAPPPIPSRKFDWHFCHKDFDGPGDHRQGHGPSYEDCLDQIADIEEDIGDAG